MLKLAHLDGHNYKILHKILTLAPILPHLPLFTGCEKHETSKMLRKVPIEN